MCAIYLTVAKYGCFVFLVKLRNNCPTVTSNRSFVNCPEILPLGSQLFTLFFFCLLPFLYFHFGAEFPSIYLVFFASLFLANCASIKEKQFSNSCLLFLRFILVLDLSIYSVYLHLAYSRPAQSRLNLVCYISTDKLL